MSQDAATWTGSRRLLKRLRNLMAGGGSAQARLDQVVRLIAAEMVAEVCSVYLVRAGEILELFATEGLNPDAVHRTRLRIGEGLVGDIAAGKRSLALADAWAHPKFAYRPETGEDVYRSLAGVPIQRGGRVLGVLAIQNRAERKYTEEEVESLETVAMVLAELAAGGELVNPMEALTDSNVLAPRRMGGVTLHGGLAAGVAYLHETRVVIRAMVAEDPAMELKRLDESVASMRDALDRLLDAAELGATGEHREVLESFRMIAADRGWLARIREAIQSGLTAEAAVQRIQDEMRARLRSASTPYLRERLHDLEDLTRRLQTHLLGSDQAPRFLPDDAIVIARSMGPAELLEYDRSKIKGLVLEDVSPTAHVAIIARALDLPAVGRIMDVAAHVDPGDAVVVDGDRGQVFLRPGQNVLDTVRRGIEARHERSVRFQALRTSPPITRDGVRVSLNVNAGLLMDMDQFAATNADGVGLYRTELAFMVRAAYPDVTTQAALYRKILDIADNRPVVFRTLDIGGDKRLPYFHTAEDENPAMGWRAIRISLDRPAMLRQQLRAMLTAAAGRSLSVMFPMIADVAEFESARALLDREHEQAAAQGAAPVELKVGAMLEAPSLLFQLGDLLPRVDFLSVGTNDLVQFLFAADRGNPKLAERYDPLSPVFLRIMRDLARRAETVGKPLTVCGEMAGRPLDALALIAVGVRRLSMAPAAVGGVKLMLRSTDLEPARRFLDSRINGTAPTLRPILRAYAADHGIPV
ncbi:MAG: phosphoenolpyruvate--protein phosphotransferase [Elsteraceae bacterium]